MSSQVVDHESGAYKFLSRLWTEGEMCLVTMEPPPKDPPAGWKAKPRHLWVTDVEDAVVKALTAARAGREVYFAPAVFGKRSRKAASVAVCRVLFVDIDAGPGKAYATIEEAAAAFKAWLESTGFFKPTFLVRSGYGLHIYWVTDEPLPYDSWLPLAQRFKSYCIKSGLKIDPARTADGASILRVPDTTNYKDADNPRPVVLLGDSGLAVSAADLERTLPMDGGLLTQATPGKPKVQSKFTAGLDPEYPPADVELITPKCRQMGDAWALKCNGIPEPLWRGVLSVLWRCEGGEELIHEWSKGDPRYDPRETRAKAERTEAPYYCSTFAEINPEGCEGCPFAGKLTSPILLGTKLPEPEVLKDDEGADERINEFGDWQVTAYGVRLRRLDDETGQESLARVTSCPLWVMEARERARDEDEPDNSSLVLQWHSLDGRSRRAVVYQSDVHEAKAFTRWLSDHNLISLVDNVKLLQAYISAYTKEIIKRKLTRTYYDRLGWFKDGIIAAGHKVTTDGVTPVRVQSTTAIALNCPAPAARVNEWSTTMQKLDKPNYGYHALALLISLGSPLLHLARWHGAVTSLAGVTGTGKTTAVKAALSIFGNPDHMLLSSTATPNAVGLHIAANRHIPSAVDEISRWTAPRICDFAYEVSNGEGKAALTQRREMQRPPTWASAVFVTTNTPIADYPQRQIDEPVRRRILELHFGRHQTLPTDLAAEIHEVIQKHHGAPGLRFLKHVCEKRDVIPSMLAAAEDWLDKNTAMEATDRFPRWTLADAVVGAQLADEIGLLHIDPFPLVRMAAQSVAAMSEESTGDEVRVVDCISEFLTENRSRIIHMDVARSKFEKAEVIFPTQEARLDPVARYASNEDKLYIMSPALNQYLQEHRISLTNLRPWRERHNVQTNVPMRLGPGLPQVKCTVIEASRVGLDMKGTFDTQLDVVEGGKKGGEG